jgi:hypothetical protein
MSVWVYLDFALKRFRVPQKWVIRPGMGDDGGQGQR